MGQPYGSGSALVSDFVAQISDFALPIFALGAVVAAVQCARTKNTKTQQGRLRELTWYGGLLALAATGMRIADSALASHHLKWWGLAIPASAVVVLAIRPGLTRAIVPVALGSLGLYGFVVARDGGDYGSVLNYGLVTADGPGTGTNLVLPQAYAFMLFAGMLSLRRPDQQTALSRRVLGRLADLSWPAQARAIVLVIVAAMAAALLTPNVWMGGGVTGIGVSAAVIAGSVLAVRRWPEVAAGVAAISLVALGAVGFYLYFAYGSGRWGLPVTDNLSIFYGLVAVSGQSMAYAVLAQAAACVGAGACLMPVTLPAAIRALGLAADADLQRRVVALTESRAVAVDAAAADLRRLERDLHDGAQARLVALGMSLRAAERLIPTSPDAASALVAEARGISARALAELRELVRGMHPPVLADRGLGDAIRSLVLDCPLRIDTDIDFDGRLPAPVETACYFAVAELLANLAKHSGARNGRISVSHSGTTLGIEVTDFGLGGADPARGTGLAGIERRLAAFDGIMAVTSPVGGPTIVVIEVPCALAGAPVRQG